MRLVTLLLLAISYARSDDDDVQLVQSVKGGFGGGQFNYNPTANQFRFYGNRSQEGRHEFEQGNNHNSSQTQSNAYGHTNSYGSEVIRNNGYNQGPYGSSYLTNGQNGYAGNTQNSAQDHNGSYGVSSQSQNNGYNQGPYGSSYLTNGQNGHAGNTQNSAQDHNGSYGVSSQSQNNGYNQGAYGVSTQSQNNGQSQGSYGASSQSQNNGLNQGSFGATSQSQNHGMNQGSYGISSNSQSNGQNQGSYGSSSQAQNNGFNQGSYGVSSNAHNNGQNQGSYGVSSNAHNNGQNQGSYGQTYNNGFNQGTYGVSFQPQNGLSQGNLVASQTSDTETGVCYIEVPTASLASDPKNIPKGNGSRPELSRVKTCCRGYERNIYNAMLCDPICTRECVNGLCIAPEVCSCFPGHTINRGGYCIATCPIGCQNGRCEGGECMCRPGFQLDINGLFCAPVCHDNCGGTGNCTAPNICKPNAGPNQGSSYGRPVINQGGPSYIGSMHGSNQGGCQNCINGACISNTCQCHKGYTTGQNGQCVPQCKLSCGPNSRCVAPDTCAPDYQLSPLPGSNPQNNIQGPIGESRPQGIYPTLPSSYPGQNPLYTNTQSVYGQDSNFSNSNYNSSSSQASSHHENQDSHNSWSQSNKYNQSNTNYNNVVGYDNLNQQTNLSHPVGTLEPNTIPTIQPFVIVPNSSYPQPSYEHRPLNLSTQNTDHGNLCSKQCINGVCVGINRCSCLSGYVLDDTDVSESTCIPHCPLGCANGVCTSPNLCLCNVGYRKDYSVKGRTGCVKRP